MYKKLLKNDQYTAALLGVMITFLFLFPLYWMVVTSLKPLPELFAKTPHMVPYAPTLKPYLDNFVKDLSLYRYIFNSFIISTGTLALTLILAAPFAYGISRLNIKGKSLILIFLLTIQMLPNIMMAMPLFIIFSKLGLLNSYWALIVANTTNALPFAILVLRPSFLGVPAGLEDAALIDGCNRFSAFWRVTLPCVVPGLITVGVLCFLNAWGDFLFALILTTNNSVQPLSMGLYKFITEYGIE